MLYQPYHIVKIHEGIKTETRRKWKTQHVKVGKIYPIMRDYRHKHNKDDGYTLIKAVFQQRLGDMTEKDAYAEGGYTMQEYQDVWRAINGSWNPDDVVYVVRFAYAKDKVES
jgi:hypothetical protein